MGLMDKVKSQASQLAEKAQHGVEAGQAKLAEVQAKKKADAMMLELGGIVYRERTGRSDESTTPRSAELIELLQKHEAEHGQVTVTSANPAIAETTGVVDPNATTPAPSSSPPSSTSGPIPQAQYGSGEAESQ